MKKVISYAIFRSDESEQWEFNAYLRGLYFNVRMNAMLFPDWISHCEIDSHSFSLYDNVIRGLHDEYGMTYAINPKQSLCKSMLWRMKPIFNSNVEYVLCRDADSLTTYREAQMVEDFLRDGRILHGINDNPAHSIPLMGGLCGFKAAPLRERYGSWEKMLALSPVEINRRGTDQQFLNSVIFKDFSPSYIIHDRGPGQYPFPLAIDPRLWESNLCVFFAGAAGVNDLETLRFFKRFAKHSNFVEIEKRYQHIFYWHTPSSI